MSVRPTLRSSTAVSLSDCVSEIFQPLRDDDLRSMDVMLFCSLACILRFSSRLNITSPGEITSRPPTDWSSHFFHQFDDLDRIFRSLRHQKGEAKLYNQTIMIVTHIMHGRDCVHCLGTLAFSLLHVV